MVEKILLELIHDDEQLASGTLRKGMQHFRQRPPRWARLKRRLKRLRYGRFNPFDQSRNRVIAPGTENNDGELRGAPLSQVLRCDSAQVVGNASTQHGAFADTAGRVQNR